MNAQVLVHLGREQREGKSEESPQHGSRGEHGCGVDGVRVQQIVDASEEDEHAAEAKGAERMMLADQWMLGELVQAKANIPMGRAIPPIMAGGKRASGGGIGPSFL